MRSHPPNRCTGSVLIEWLVGGVAVMLTCALALECAHWYITRHITHIALMEAARAGSREHGRPTAIRRAFLQAMRARFVSPDGHAQRRMTAFFKDVHARSGEPAWRIEQISPSASDFAAWHDPTVRVPEAKGRKILRHDGAESDGMPRWLKGPPLPADRHGAGHTGATEAGSTLHLSLTYLQPVLSPGLASVITWLAQNKIMPGAHASGMIVIKGDILIEMQSHAVQWSNGVILSQD